MRTRPRQRGLVERTRYDERSRADELFSHKRKRPAFLRAFEFDGAGTKSRTRDLLITSQLLYQLSYTGINGAHYNDSESVVNR